ncbi:MAG: hypothetical protein AB7P02_05185 [Alphaproteobacteria bacterium]
MTRDLALEADYRKLDVLVARARGAPKGHREEAARRARELRTRTLRAELGVRAKGRRR